MGDDKRRLLSKLDTSGGPEACWRFIGNVSGHGYPTFYMKGKYLAIHRAAYQLLIGPVPEGLEVDHLCHNWNECAGGSTCLHRCCANPRHLRAVTRRDNDIRGNGISGINHRKTHCPRGHLYDEVNTYRRPDKRSEQTARDCRKCRTEAQRRYVRAKAVGLDPAGSIAHPKRLPP